MHAADAMWSVDDSVVVGVDGSPDGRRALDWALELAEREQRPATLLHAGLGGDAAIAEAEAHARQHAPDVKVGVLRTADDARHALIDASERASVVVIGARGCGPLSRLRLGSVAHAVSRHAFCPVVVTRASGADRPETVLAGVDGGRGSEQVLEFAFRVAEARRWPVTALHCFWDDTAVTGDLDPDVAEGRPETRAVAEVLAAVSGRHPDVEFSTLMSRGFADRRLLAAAPKSGLVVIGYRERPWLASLVYGHVTPVVVENAVGDVAVVPLLDGAELW